MKGLSLLFMVALVGVANGQALCSRSQEEVINTDNCVRWYFTCLAADLTCRRPAPEYEALSCAQRGELFLKSIFQEAEQRCLVFDYEEAGAALRSKLMLLPD